jgi:hypothetical protein
MHWAEILMGVETEEKEENNRGGRRQHMKAK